MWHLVPWPGTKPRLPGLRAWSLSHWTSREAPWVFLFLGSLLHFASTHFQESSKENRGEFSWMPACLMIPLVYPQPLVDKLGSGLQSEIFSHDFEGITCFFPTAVVEKSDSCFFIYDLLLLLSRFSRVQLCVTPETAAHQALPSLGFSRQEHWSGLPFPSPVHESEK